MKITILTLGTLGDVQPYAVLGKALKESGHQVTLATAKNFKSLIISYGIDFIAVEADFQAVLESDEGKKMLKGNLFAIRRNLKTWIYPLITNSLIEFYKLAMGSDLVLYHVKTLADSFADQFPHKMIRVNLLPIVEPTKEFVNPSFSGLSIPKILNRLSYTLSNFSIKFLSKPIGAFRIKFDLPKKFEIPKVRNIYALSSNFIAKPKDYHISSKFYGFWFGKSTEELTEEITNFINEGEPPLVLTFGSMPFKSKFNFETTIIKLINLLTTRIIIIKGWGIEKTNLLENNKKIKIINNAPYEKLFPLCKAMIHHGGIGTTSECLRAGKPFMICPVLHPIGDQMFWGKVAFNKGIAVKPIPLKTMTENKFIESIRELLTNKKLYVNAKQLKLKINTERGLEKTINILEEIAAKYVIQ